MKNIAYCTTRQWNCGDEFILFGCINLVEEIIGKHNKIIYNRNPDIRPENGLDVFARNLKPSNLPSFLYKKEALYRIDFYDNSVKFDTDLSYIDYAIFAGSPEWITDRCVNFYQHILVNNLPTFILGIGYSQDSVPEFMYEVINKSLLFTVRDKNLLQTKLAKDCNAIYLPCPALLCAKIGDEKNISEVQQIGLVFQANLENSTRMQSVNNETYRFICEFYTDLINKYKNYKISIICHYINEVELAHKLFNRCNVDILYSFDAKDYFNIYKRFDLVISPRVHGCGISASLGIPSFIIKHDARGNTADGFLAEEININDNIENIYKKINDKIVNIDTANKNLVQHKLLTYQKYKQLLEQAVVLPYPKYNIDLRKYDYGYCIDNINRFE